MKLGLELLLLVLLQLLGYHLPLLLGYKQPHATLTVFSWTPWKKSSWITQHCQTPKDGSMKENEMHIISSKIRRIKKNKYAQFSQAPRLDPVEQTKERVAKQQAVEENTKKQQLQRGTSTPQVTIYQLNGLLSCLLLYL